MAVTLRDFMTSDDVLTIPADTTDVLGGAAPQPGSTSLSVEGLRRLHQLVGTLDPPAQRRGRRPGRK